MARQFDIARVGTLCVGALLLAQGGRCAASALGPERNVYGNSAFEERRTECRIPGSDAVARLYRGNAGATVAYWYSVTLEHRGGQERQFWYSYSSPWVDSIACRPGTVVLFAHDSTGRALTPRFSLAAVDTAFVPRPLVYTRGSPTRVSRAARRARRLDVVSLWISGTLLLAGGALILRALDPASRSPRPL